MFLRRSLSLFLIGIGIGSPWLVRDWLASRAQENSARPTLAESTWTERLREKFRFQNDGAEAVAVVEEVKPVRAEREPYALASATKRIMEGFLGGAGEIESGGLKGWFSPGELPPSTARSGAIVEAALSHLSGDLATMGMKAGDPVFLRAFKEEAELEVWMKPAGEPYFLLFKVYRLAGSAGQPGPKLREGDGQAPEGFYTASAASMRPETRHFLGIDIGYPNEYDRQKGRTGSDLLIHAGTAGGGAYVLSPEGMSEVYALVDAACRAGQGEVGVHLFPFRMTDARMDRVWAKPTRWTGEWVNLKEGYDFFENVRLPPRVGFGGDRYDFFIASVEN